MKLQKGKRRPFLAGLAVLGMALFVSEPGAFAESEKASPHETILFLGDSVNRANAMAQELAMKNPEKFG